MPERPDNPRASEPTPPPQGLPVGVEEDLPVRHAKPKPNIRVPALNITSFLDMSFALLTMLILLANFSVGEGVLTANIPVGIGGVGKTDAVQLPKLPITIILDPVAGKPDDVLIRVDGAPFTSVTGFTDLGDQLARNRRDPRLNPNGIIPDDTPIVIRPESAIRWQHVVNAFNAAVRARYKSVSFAQTAEDLSGLTNGK